MRAFRSGIRSLIIFLEVFVSCPLKQKSRGTRAARLSALLQGGGAYGAQRLHAAAVTLPDALVAVLRDEKVFELCAMIVKWILNKIACLKRAARDEDSHGERKKVCVHDFFLSVLS